MTRQSTKQRGVSLVEVLLTLAISSLLLGSVLVGRNSVRSQAQFSDGIERIKETVLSIKSQANTSNNSTGNGTSSNSLTLGRFIHFTRDSDAYDTGTLLCLTGSGSTCGNRVNVTDQASGELPWRMTYKGNSVSSEPDLTLIFARDDNAGAIFTGYWFAGRLVNGTDVAQYQQLANQKTIVLNFESPDGRRATITVDPATGSVSRKVL